MLPNKSLVVIFCRTIFHDFIGCKNHATVFYEAPAEIMQISTTKNVICRTSLIILKRLSRNARGVNDFLTIVEESLTIKKTLKSRYAIYIRPLMR